MQIVINHTVRPLIITKTLPSKTNVLNYETVRFLPGSNEADDSTVEAIERSATARHWVEKRWLEIPKARSSDGEGLEGFEPGAAMTFVAECMDVQTLDRWSDVEKRKDVKAAIKKRQRELDRVLSREPEKDSA